MRARKQAAPGSKEVEEHNLDQAAFRSWCPRCVTGGADSYGHTRKAQKESDAPIVVMDYVHTRGEQGKEEERGEPTKVVPNRGVVRQAVEVSKRMVEPFGGESVMSRYFLKKYLSVNIKRAGWRRTLS